MTVKQLIQRLAHVNGELELLVEDADGDFVEASNIILTLVDDIKQSKIGLVIYID
jgi:hypothetical protein